MLYLHQSASRQQNRLNIVVKKIPEWARGPQLREALEKQFGENRMDPDLIFPEVHTCDLEDVFDSRKKRYANKRLRWTIQLTELFK